MSETILGKWREFDVKLVRGIDGPYAIDESQRHVLIRRTWRLDRMLAALVSAMNDVSRRDALWADRVNGKAMFLCIDFVTIAGETWSVLGCPLIFDDAGQMKPYAIDEERREIRINARMNAVASGPAIVKAVSDIWRDKMLELTERAEAVFDTFTGATATA